MDTRQNLVGYPPNIRLKKNLNGTHLIPAFSHGHLPEAGREIQTELNRIRDDDNNGPLAENQPEASLRAVSQL